MPATPKLFLGIIFFGLLLVLGLAFYRPILEAAADFLIVEEGPVKSDAAVVLSGEAGERIDYAAELFHQNLVKYLILSGDTPGFTVKEMESRALKAGVPEKFIILEPNSQSTYENARAVRKIARAKGFQSLILVTSSYHSRRAGWIFKKIFKNDRIDLRICPSPQSWFKKENWWGKPNHVLILKREYERLIWYYLYYGLLNKVAK